MKYKLEYSQIVRKKLKLLKLFLTEQFGEEVAVSSVKKITDKARSLQDNPSTGCNLGEKFEIETDFCSIYVNHNHLFYYIEDDVIIIAEMFDEREDFMYKLFGISGRTQESIDYWGE